MEMATCVCKGGILLHSHETAQRCSPPTHCQKAPPFSPRVCGAIEQPHSLRSVSLCPALPQGHRHRPSQDGGRRPPLSAGARRRPPGPSARDPPARGRGGAGSAHARERPERPGGSPAGALCPALPLAASRTFHLLPGRGRQSPARSHSAGRAARADCAGRHSRSAVAPRALGGPRRYGREGRGRRSLCVAPAVAQGQREGGGGRPGPR